MLTFILIETVADQQQYDFQTEKYRRLRAGEPLTGDYALGFCARGRWARVRHPNYAAEQAGWLSFLPLQRGGHGALVQLVAHRRPAAALSGQLRLQ